MSQEKLFILTKSGEEEIKPSAKYDSNEIAYLNNSLALTVQQLKNKDLLLPSGRLVKADSNESVFLREKLVDIIKTNITTWYQDLVARVAFSVRNTGNPGARSLLYAENSQTGRARLAGVHNNNRSKSGVSTTPTYSPIYNHEAGMEYTLYDIEAAMFANEPLNSRLAQADKQSHEIALEENVFATSTYDEEKNIPGVKNQLTKFITSSDTPDLNDFNLLTASAQDAYDYLVKVLTAPTNFTNKSMATATDLMTSMRVINRLKTLKFTNTLGDTVAAALFQNTDLKRMIPAPVLIGTSNDKSALMVGNFQNTEIGEVIITRNYTTLPLQQDSTCFHITSLSGLGGLFVYKKAWAYVTNVGTP